MIHQVLKDTFGYDAFRPMQEDAIQAVLDKKDVLLVMPTGGGKSICYQVPALASEGIGIVISPLIALMNDQVLALQQNGVNAAAYHSQIEYDKKNAMMDSIGKGEMKLIYVSPESIRSESFVNYLKRQQISLIAIDEAHCVSMWGNDFRQDYARLSSLKETFPNVPLIAVTATADKATRDDISKTLKLNDPVAITGSFARKNIHISTRPGQERFKQILHFLKDKQDSNGIIYVTTRKNAESISSKLNQQGIESAFYHAGMERADREKVHLDFVHDRVRIVCATIAFGMGIDKSNIRFVIHYNLSKNIESYYQEIGRAGRDGTAAEAVLFSSFTDVNQFRSFIDDSESTAAYKQVQHQKLDRMWSFANGHHCRTNMILSYFGEFKEETCGNCDNCLEPPTTFDGTRFTQMALSAITRTKEQMPLNMLIDVLRGSGKQEIYQAGYNQIKTYGAGRDIPFADWRSYITQMLEQGLIQLDYTKGSVIKLTPRSKDVLFNGEQIQLVKFEWKEKSAKKPKPELTFSDKDVDVDLFKRLKSLRMTLAREQNVPAYVIFPNKSLEEMAATKPTDTLAFSLISGVGKKKLESYGDVFLKEIQAYQNG